MEQEWVAYSFNYSLVKFFPMSVIYITNQQINQINKRDNIEAAFPLNVLCINCSEKFGNFRGKHRWRRLKFIFLINTTK